MVLISVLCCRLGKCCRVLLCDRCFCCGIEWVLFMVLYNVRLVVMYGCF